MKKPTAKKRKKSLFGLSPKLFWGGVALLAAIVIFAALEYGGVTSIFIKDNPPTAVEELPTEDSGIYSPTTDEEKQEVEKNKANSNPTSNNPPSIPSTVVIESVEQQSDIDSIVVKSKLTGNGWSSCKLTLVKGSNTVIKTAETLYQSGYSTCLGFSVPVDELKESGQWQVKLIGVKLDGTTAEAESKTVNVTK